MLRLGPLHLHWSLLLGATLFCAAQPRPLLLLGYAAVLLAHVAGHAAALPGTRVGVSAGLALQATSRGFVRLWASGEWRREDFGPLSCFDDWPA